jgi:2-isopropylmalate synthase
MAVKTREDFFGVGIGADTTQLLETSRLVSRLTGYPVQYNKAVVGRNAFAHESGIHQHGVLKNRETYEIMDPRSVGHQSTIVLGKHSGRAAFSDALDKLGIRLEDTDFTRAFARFKELADRKGEISEEGIRAIVAEGPTDTSGLVRLIGIHVSGGNDETPVAVVRLEQGGVEREVEADGDGMVNAAFVAIQDAFDVPATLVDYRVSPITSGADAMAEVAVIVQVGAATYSGRGVSTDVVEGSARAFVAALNKVIVAESGGALGSSHEAGG